MASDAAVFAPASQRPTNTLNGTVLKASRAGKEELVV
jgi:hypothetical protein